VTIDRRKFLVGSGLGAVGALTGLSGASAADAVAPQAGAGADATLGPVPFHGRHQAGILTPAPPAAAFLALDVITEDRDTLAVLLRTITGRAR
jgi:deferrochelatase/peroxidase EfeB